MVDKLPPMVSMRLTPQESEDDYPCIPFPGDAPAYPYGLCITLCEDELEKLGLENDDLEVGDTVHLFAFALVTSKSTSQTQDGDAHCRVELQITHLAGEDEDSENEEEDEEFGPTIKLYRNR